MRTFMMGTFASDGSMVAARFTTCEGKWAAWEDFEAIVPSVRLELKKQGRTGSFDLIMYEVGQYVKATGRVGPNQFPRGCHKGGMPRYIDYYRKLVIK